MSWTIRDKFEQHRGHFYAGGLCLILANLLDLAIPQFVMVGISALTAGASMTTIVSNIIIIALLYGVVRVLSRIFIFYAGRQIEYEMKVSVFDHLLLLPMKFFQQFSTGDLISRSTNDLTSIRLLFGPAFLGSISTIFRLIGSIILMGNISWKMTVWVVVPIPIMILLMRFIAKRMYHYSRKRQESLADLSSRVQEDFAGITTIAAFCEQASSVEAFEEKSMEYYECSLAFAKIQALIFPMMAIVMGLVLGGLLFVGGESVIAGELTAGEFVAFLLYFHRLRWPMASLGWVASLWQRGKSAFDRVVEILDKPVAHEGEQSPQKSFEETLSIQNVSMAYDDTPILNDINFELKKGQTIAIVGKTASGKSTLVKSLVRLETIVEGQISLDGNNIDSLHSHYLRNQISIVPQETFLFSRTIRENIDLENASTDAARKAAIEAGLEKDIEQFPKGLETQVGERGITVSGGQRQRIALARALCRNSSCLILDDSFSNIDAETEARILKTLESSGRTLIVISHRLSAVKAADQILVLSEGTIAEKGTHTTLIEKEGIYRELYQEQLK